MNNIYNLVITKAGCMHEKSEDAFVTRCSKKSVHFMSSSITRKREKDSNSRYRKLYVLKVEYIGNGLLVIFAKMLVIFAYFFLESIVEVIAKHVLKYQTHINSLKS